MKHIQKGQEPTSLAQHRRSAAATYDNYTDKDALREALLEEQGHLCCYCMQRITAASMKIEHWASQHEHAALALTYRNLLGACRGGEGEPRQHQHCDTHKGATPLTVSPLEARHCEQAIHYLPNGEVRSNDAVIQRDLEETLNLNTDKLRRNRKSVLDEALQKLSARQVGTWTGATLAREIERWSGKDGGGRYREYCQVVVYYLRKKQDRQKRLAAR